MTRNDMDPVDHGWHLVVMLAILVGGAVAICWIVGAFADSGF